MVPRPLSDARDTAPVLLDGARPDLVTALGDLWLAVTRAGGAVGFLPGSPEEEVRAAAQDTVQQVRSGTAHLLGALGPGSMAQLVGCVFLVPQTGAVPVLHRGTLLRLMVHPDAGGRGHGGRLLAAAADLARDLGLEQLMLFARGGQGLEPFYLAQGWQEVGRWRGSLKVADERRDDVWFARDVPPPQ